MTNLAPPERESSTRTLPQMCLCDRLHDRQTQSEAFVALRHVRSSETLEDSLRGPPRERPARCPPPPAAPCRWSSRAASCDAVARSRCASPRCRQSWSSAWVIRCSSRSAVACSGGRSPSCQSRSPRARRLLDARWPPCRRGGSEPGSRSQDARLASRMSSSTQALTSGRSRRAGAPWSRSTSSGSAWSTSSRWPRSTVSGVRSSCPASSRNCRWELKPSSQATEHRVERRSQLGDVVVALLRQPPGQVRCGDVARRRRATPAAGAAACPPEARRRRRSGRAGPGRRTA